MSDLPTTVAAINDALGQLLESAQLRPLNDGHVLFGRQFVDDVRAPNSIVMVPVRGTFGPPQATASVNGTGTQDRLRQRPLWSESTEFEVHVWGAATPSRFEDDFRVTQLLYRLLLQACFSVATTQIRPGAFTWESQSASAVTREGLGQYLIFQLTVLSPVTGPTVNFVRPGTVLVPTLNYHP